MRQVGSRTSAILLGTFYEALASARRADLSCPPQGNIDGSALLKSEAVPGVRQADDGRAGRRRAGPAAIRLQLLRRRPAARSRSAHVGRKSAEAAREIARAVGSREPAMRRFVLAALRRFALLAVPSVLEGIAIVRRCSRQASYRS